MLNQRAPSLLAAVGAALIGCQSSKSGKDESLSSGPGDFAAEFLRAEPYSKVRVLLDYADGYAPFDPTLDELVGIVRPLLDKPSGFTMDGARALPIGTGDGIEAGKRYSIEEVRAIEERVRTAYKDPDTGEAVLHILYLNGSFAEDTDTSKVLAAAHRGSSIVVFKDTVKSSCAPPPGMRPPVNRPADYCQKSERKILQHEIGHILGLVNSGTPMQAEHQDVPNGAHDTNQCCVMYWERHRGKKLPEECSNPPNVDFDDACLADLKALRDG